MDVQIERAGDTATVVLVGELDAHTCGAVAERIGEAVSGAKEVVVDLGGVTFLDSSGLRVLVRARQEAAQAGARLRLRDVADPVARVLQITGLDGEFERV